MRFWWARSCNAADKRGVGWRTSGDGRTASIRTRAIGALSTLVYISTSRHGQCGRASRNTDTEERDTEIQLVVSPVSDQSVSPADLGVFVWSADSEDMVLAGPAKWRWRRLAGNEADAIGTVPVPWAGPFRCKNINVFFQIKYTEAIISNGTRKLLWFEITKIIVSYVIIFAHFRFPWTCGYADQWV